MTRRWRTVSIAAIALSVVAGIACLVVVPGDTGGLLAIVLMGGSLGAGMLLLFLEVGLSEDREREAALRPRPEPRPGHQHPPRLRPMPRRPRRIGR